MQIPSVPQRIDFKTYLGFTDGVRCDQRDHAHRRNERAPFRNVGLNKMRQSLDSLTACLPLLVRPHLAHSRLGFDKCSFNRAVLPTF